MFSPHNIEERHGKFRERPEKWLMYVLSHAMYNLAVELPNKGHFLEVK